MPRLEARRQKQLAKKKARRNAKRQEALRERSLSTPQRLAAPGSEIIDCLLNRAHLSEKGITNAACAVRLKTGEIGIVVYLIDTWCLGVKDVFARIASAEVYADWSDNFRKQTGAKSVSPATLRRLLDDAVAYARACGQPPHPQYHRFQPVLARIDPTDAKERFQMGHNGKPHFFAGTDDHPARCHEVSARLERACGKGNYSVTIPIAPGLSITQLGDDEAAIAAEFDDGDESAD